MKQADILIVGAGPTGLTLAINLLRNGVKCKVIDKRKRLEKSGSKAITMNAATLKLFHNMEIVDKLINCGCKVKDIYVHWNNIRLTHLNYGYLDGPYKYFLSIPQPDTERILLEHFQYMGGQVDFSTEITAISNINSNSSISAIVLSNGRMENHQPKYLIGCDGANSKVREIVGSNFEGRDYGIFFELIDVYLEWEGNKSATHYYVVEDCFVIIIPMTNNMHRIVFKNNINNIEKMRVEKSVAYYENIIKHCKVPNLKIKQVLWRSFSKFYNRLIDNYSYGDKVFFAGDACHLFSPIGGLGMNTGVQDAFNLSWRLSGVISGKYTRNILKEYGVERQNIGKLLLKSTDASTELIARINKNDEAIEKWLPLIKNRKILRQTLPYNFSGLGHNYELTNNFIEHVSYATGINLFNKQMVSTYDIVNGKNFNILYFDSLYSTIIDKVIEDLNLEIQAWFVTDKMIIPTNSKHYVIFDKYNEFNQTLRVQDMDLVVIRPDGYVSLKCNAQSIHLLQTYFNAVVNIRS